MTESMIYILGAVAMWFVIIKSAYWLVQLVRQGSFFKHEKKIKEAQAIQATADPVYTQHMLDTIHDLVNRVSVIEFKKLMDTKDDLSKMHMSALKPVIDKIAHRVHNGVKNYISKCGILDEQFIEEYIIDVTMMSVKSLMKKQIDITLEEESDF